MNFLQFLLSFIVATQMNSAFIFAQYLVEVLESSFGTQHPVLRCEATGANFGANVLGMYRKYSNHGIFGHKIFDAKFIF
jgi:hypothetical protein